MLAMLKGGTTSFEVVLTLELEVLAIVKGAQNVSILSKGGTKKVVSWGGGGGALQNGKIADPKFLPIFNDQSLN